MLEDLFETFKEMVVISIAKRKIEEGTELTEEEKDKVLQQVFSAARKGLREGKEFRDTKARVAFTTLSIVTKLLGEKGKGFHTASKVVKTSTKNNVDNYKRLLRGVDITYKNQELENFATLIAQYEETEEYGRLMSEFIVAFMEANNSYKKDFHSPIGTELVEQMEVHRKAVLELDRGYIKK